jgi:hypothetical protein
LGDIRLPYNPRATVKIGDNGDAKTNSYQLKILHYRPPVKKKACRTLKMRHA